MASCYCCTIICDSSFFHSYHVCNWQTTSTNIKGGLRMIELKGVVKVFKSGEAQVTALNDIDLHIEKGEFVLIKGHSGCGKSTLLFTMGGMLKPSAGAVRVSLQELYLISEKERLNFRSRVSGFVFQSYYLIPYLSVEENIRVGNELKGVSITNEEVHDIAKQLGIGHRLKHKPSELSVGEKQRVSLARAMIRKPQIIFADEPTGNLDPENAAEVLRYLNKFKEDGGTVVMVTHGNDADKYATRQIKMKQGQVLAE
ncbi:ABC transporter ATP-binding protein [Puteibacter caeruleilacunae]|nr:ABC transporter ATP-binding protein [Puteibacter caeruleilacunae]